MTEIQHILCPVDFSETSELALAQAVSLAAKLSAEVTVLFVYQVPTYAVLDASFVPSPTWVANLMDASKNELEKWVARHQEKNSIALKAKLAQGTPHVEINRVAKELGANMIVMGTHGRTGLRRVVIGSVAERVVRTASVPVLAVPLRETT